MNNEILDRPEIETNQKSFERSLKLLILAIISFSFSLWMTSKTGNNALLPIEPYESLGIAAIILFMLLSFLSFINIIQSYRKKEDQSTMRTIVLGVNLFIMVWYIFIIGILTYDTF